MQRKRGRGRRSGGNNNNNPNRHYESTGPDVKIRGSAQQILDKYQQYARDAMTAGDRVKAEAHYQHAEHYARIVASFQKDKPRNKNDDNDSDDNDDNSSDNDDNTYNERNDGRSDNRSDNRSDRKSGRDRSDDSDDDQDNASNTEEKKPRRGRKPKASQDDPMKVIDADDNDGGDTSGASGEEKAEAKPKRRTYRKKADQDAESGSEAQGVMSTLARGRSKSADSDAPAEAAE